jgi:Ca-activated chloride channel family protein
LVNVFATVTDNHGAPVGGLTKGDFKIYEDGVEQQISVFDRESGLPLNIVMALDASLSTRKDLPLELESARRFAHAILRPNKDAISVYQFSETVTELQTFTGDLRRVDQGIDRVRTGSSTALYDALYLGSEALNRQQGRKVMIVITDGGDTASKTSYQEAVRAAQIAETIVYSIIMVPIEASAGRDTGGEHALIQLSEDTGGKHYYATSIKQLDRAFHEISDELRTQYLVAYYPPKVARDDFRRITLEITRQAPEGLQFSAHYRTGYYTSKLQ